MKKSASLIIVLTVTAVLSGAILSLLDSVTSPIIKEYEKKVMQDAVKEVLPGIDGFDEQTLNGTTFFVGKKDGAATCVAFEAKGNGFQSELKMLVGMDIQMEELKSIKILSQFETPGLGTKIENDPTNKADVKWFAKQFADFTHFTGSDDIQLIKMETPDKSKFQIKAITGATISSKAVVDILNASIKEHREIFLGNDRKNQEVQ